MPGAAARRRCARGRPGRRRGRRRDRRAPPGATRSLVAPSGVASGKAGLAGVPSCQPAAPPPGPMDPPDRPHISAVILARNRADALRTVLTRLDALPVDEVIVVDNGSEDATPALVDGWGGNVRRIANGRNIGVAGRNVG